MCRTMVDYATRDEMRGIGALFEQLDSKISLLAEGIMNVRDELKADLRATEDRLANRIGIVEDVVRQSSAEIRENRTAIFQNREAIVENRQAIRENRDAIRENRDAIRENRDAIEDVRKRL